MGTEWERGDPRRTKIIDVVEPPYTNPNGVPDCDITEREARLWLLSQGERAGSGSVVYDNNIERWRRGTGMPAVAEERRCGSCRKIFTPLRSTGEFCSPACRVRASRRVTLTGKSIPE